MINNTIDQSQLERLQELAIKAGEVASTSISKILGAEVSIHASTVEVISPTQLDKKFPDPEALFTTVALKVTNNLSGIIIFLESQDDAQKMANQLSTDNENQRTKLSEIDESTLKEVGNIIVGSFLSEISKSTGLQVIQSVPDIATDMIKATLDELSGQIALNSSRSLSVVIDLHIEPQGSEAKLVLMLDADSSELLAKSL